MRGIFIGLLAMAVAGFCTGVGQGGAKEGKMRWTHKKTGACKCFEPIVVPGAKDKKPGVAQVKIVFKANALAEFCLIGDGDTDLDIVVLDSKGQTVMVGGKVLKDEDPPANQGGGSDICIVRWTPQREEEFTIVIVNNDQEVNIAQAGCN